MLNNVKTLVSSLFHPDVLLKNKHHFEEIVANADGSGNALSVGSTLGDNAWFYFMTEGLIFDVYRLEKIVQLRGVIHKGIIITNRSSLSSRHRDRMPPDRKLFGTPQTETGGWAYGSHQQHLFRASQGPLQPHHFAGAR